MEEIVDSFIKQMKLAAGLNTQLVFKAWDAVSGASAFTLKKFYRGGTLYVTLGSSMARTQLLIQKDVLVEKMNEYLRKDPLFTEDNRSAGYIKDLVLK